MGEAWNKVQNRKQAKVKLSELIVLSGKNYIARKDFLDGKAEADAFVNKQYVKLHQSTLRKVDIFANVVERAAGGSLKTNSTWKDIYGSYSEHLSR